MDRKYNKLNIIDKEDIEEKIKNIIQVTSNNNMLIISEKHNKVYLPYTIDELENYIRAYPTSYLSLKEVVEREFIVSFDSFFKNPTQSRFLETYNLMRSRVGKTPIVSFLYAIKLSNKQNLNPAIIAACKTQQELTDYIECLNYKKLDEFDSFDIIYELIQKSSKQLVY